MGHFRRDEQAYTTGIFEDTDANLSAYLTIGHPQYYPMDDLKEATESYPIDAMYYPDTPGLDTLHQEDWHDASQVSPPIHTNPPNYSEPEHQRNTRDPSTVTLESLENSLKTLTTLVRCGLSPQEIEASLKRVLVEALESAPSPDPIVEMEEQTGETVEEDATTAVEEHGHGHEPVEPPTLRVYQKEKLSSRRNRSESLTMSSFAALPVTDMGSLQSSVSNSSLSSATTAPSSTGSLTPLGGQDGEEEEPKRYPCVKDVNFMIELLFVS
jgi:hypothetical protein